MRLFIFISIFTIISCQPKSDNKSVITSELKEKWPTKGWEYKSFTETGIDSTLIYSIKDSVKQKHSLLIIKDGGIVYESYQSPYTKDTVIQTSSCTKSVISILFGMIFKDSLTEYENKSAISFFPEYSIRDTLKEKIKIKHLLSMSSGLSWAGGVGGKDLVAMNRTNDWPGYVLSRDYIRPPNEKFNYNSGGTQVVAAILQKTLQGDLVNYANENLFMPLGIENYRWEKTPDGYPKAGWGLFMNMKDMAKLGYLLLKNGKWDGKQIVPIEWIDKATSPQINVNDSWDYGYQFWIPKDLGYKSYFFRGHYPPVSKRIVVIPELNMVISYLGETRDLKGIIKKYIIPAIEPTTPSL